MRPTQMPSQRQLLLLALCRPKGVSWSVIAREAQRPDGLARLAAGQVTEENAEARRTAKLLAELPNEPITLLRDIRESIEAAFAEGSSLTTVLDDDYPLNLRSIYNLPPFLFYKGKLGPDDTQAVAVVGTRKPSDHGLELAGELARALASKGVTVLSGLAAGIDTAAHEGALEVSGRTVAVIGTGIRRVYPAKNRRLQEHIAASGAVVSQFWPDSAPLGSNFLLRNVVMSGLGQGTVVVEAGPTSGAKSQARMALLHGKKVFFPRVMIDTFEWARRYSSRPGALVVDSVEEILANLKPPDVIRERDARRMQLSMMFG